MIGVAVARALLSNPNSVVLLLTYTNHALDSFCEAVLDSGLPMTQLLRIGRRSKAERLAPACFHTIKSNTVPRVPLELSEQRRRGDLIETSDGAVQGLRELWDRLVGGPWGGQAADVPLLLLEEVIEVRPAAAAETPQTRLPSRSSCSSLARSAMRAIEVATWHRACVRLVVNS